MSPKQITAANWKATEATKVERRRQICASLEITVVPLIKVRMCRNLSTRSVVEYGQPECEADRSDHRRAELVTIGGNRQSCDVNFAVNAFLSGGIEVAVVKVRTYDAPAPARGPRRPGDYASRLSTRITFRASVRRSCEKGGLGAAHRMPGSKRIAIAASSAPQRAYSSNRNYEDYRPTLWTKSATPRGAIGRPWRM